MSLRYTISDSNSKFLKPSGNSGIVDVVNDFAWTISPKESRKDVPYAYLKEYQQTQGQLIASILYYSRVAENVSAAEGSIFDRLVTSPKDPGEVFKYKYIAEPTGFEYKFPYFSQDKISRTTDFNNEQDQNPFSTFSELGKSVLGFGTNRARAAYEKAAGAAYRISQIAGLAGGLINTLMPGKLSFEPPQSWSGTSEQSYTIKFQLLNTGTIEDVENNRNLAHILQYQNSPSRRNFAIVDPVVIYSLLIPDVVSFPVCYISNLQITNLGNNRIMQSESGIERIIPEAYGFSITLTPLLMPSRNIVGKLDNGETVQAISDVRDVVGSISDSLGNISESLAQGIRTNNTPSTNGQ